MLCFCLCGVGLFTIILNKMVIPNVFLINLTEHNAVIGNCFCQVCRRSRLTELVGRNLTQGQMYLEFKHLLPHKEDKCLDKVFANTINIVVSGKAYKDKCLEGSGYAYFRSWAKHEPQLSALPVKEVNLLCHRVNEATWVYDNWDKIVSNLTDERVFAIDARRLSLSQLYLAKNIDWCLSLNDRLRRKGKRAGEPLWTKEKFDDIFQNIIQSGILEDIQHSPSVAASIGGQLQNAMVAYCRRRYQPY